MLMYRTEIGVETERDVEGRQASDNSEQEEARGNRGI